MTVRPASVPRRGLARGVLVLAILGLGGSASAAEPEDCRWFPDLRCGRSGRFEGFQKPIVQPYLFEDPFITTGVYPYFLWHDTPDDSAFGGGEIYGVALQARLALTDRLALIATKDGFIWSRPDLELGGTTVLDDQQGWMNVAGGLKYALIQRPEDDFILSTALRLEAPVGSRDVFQGETGYLVLPSASAAWGLGGLHLIGGLGAQVPLDGRKNSSQLFYQLYADYRVCERFQPFLQLSGVHEIESGNGERKVRTRLGTLEVGQIEDLFGTFEGVDLVNLGSEGVDNQDVITLAVGGHLPISRHVTFSIAYERPITSREDLFEQRVTTALRLEF
jgi:hypothetical protein